MSHKHTQRKILLTAAVLSAISVPAYASARDGGTSVVTDEVVVTASRTEQEIK